MSGRERGGLPCTVTVMLLSAGEYNDGDVTLHRYTRPLIVLSTDCSVRVSELLATVPSCDSHVIVVSDSDPRLHDMVAVLPTVRFW